MTSQPGVLIKAVNLHFDSFLYIYRFFYNCKIYGFERLLTLTPPQANENNIVMNVLKYLTLTSSCFSYFTQTGVPLHGIVSIFHFVTSKCSLICTSFCSLDKTELR